MRLEEGDKHRIERIPVSTVIEDITARKIFNSRGEETLEVDVTTLAGFGRASE